MTSFNSPLLIRLLTHLLIISSCCLIHSKDHFSSLSLISHNSSLTSESDSSFSTFPAHSCNNGLGRLVYEKVSDHKLVGAVGSNPPSTKAFVETVSRNGPPLKVLEECSRRCQEDKVASISSCSSFDFMPGRRRSSPFPKFPNGPHMMPVLTAEYEDSKCSFFSGGEDGKTETQLIPSDNTWNFNRVCLSSKKINECTNRLYVFERIPGYRLEGQQDKEIHASNRSACEEACLDASDLPCRAASYDAPRNKCWLHKETRYMTPHTFKHDPSFDYLENMCVKSKLRYSMF